jgi:hypothetical protein
LLTLGPVWDFNLSFGNSYYYDGERIENWNLETLIKVTQGDFSPPFWMEIIWNDVNFKSKFTERWKELRATTLHTDTLLTYIDALADTLNEAQERNFTVWPILGQYVWPNFFIGDTWEEEIEHLKEWTQGRVEWIDKNVENLTRSKTHTDIEKSGLPLVFDLEQNYPNPFNPLTHIKYSLTEKSTITLTVYNMLGLEIKTLAEEFQSAGSHLIIWDGMDKSGNLAPSGLYTVRLKADSKVLTRKMLLVR